MLMAVILWGFSIGGGVAGYGGVVGACVRRLGAGSVGCSYLQLPDFESTNGKGGWMIEKGRDARVAIGGSMVLVRGAGGSFAFNARLGVCRVHVQGNAGGKIWENIESV